MLMRNRNEPKAAANGQPLAGLQTQSRSLPGRGSPTILAKGLTKGTPFHQIRLAMNDRSILVWRQIEVMGSLGIFIGAGA